MSDYVEMLISQAGGDGDGHTKATTMPKGITRGYGNAFLDMIGEAAAKALTIKELKDFNDLDCYREIARAELINRLDLDHEPPAAAA
jgi:hypothetical protein